VASEEDSRDDNIRAVVNIYQRGNKALLFQFAPVATCYNSVLTLLG
jgi:hypothetical protein